MIFVLMHMQAHKQSAVTECHVPPKIANMATRIFSAQIVSVCSILFQILNNFSFACDIK